MKKLYLIAENFEIFYHLVWLSCTKKLKRKTTIKSLLLIVLKYGCLELFTNLIIKGIVHFATSSVLSEIYNDFIYEPSLSYNLT